MSYRFSKPWGGILSPRDFEEFAWPHLVNLVSEFKKRCSQPVVYYIKGSGGVLRILKDLPVDVLGVDWTMDITDVSRLTGNRFVFQANLDPTVLFSTKDVIEERAREILLQGKETRGHIFNLDPA